MSVETTASEDVHVAMCARDAGEKDIRDVMMVAHRLLDEALAKMEANLDDVIANKVFAPGSPQ